MPIMKGAYSATYNAQAVGNTEIGFKLSYSYRAKGIVFDVVGGNPVDMLLDGIDMKVGFVAQEWDAAAVPALRWPFSATLGRTTPSGLSMWTAAKPLLMTACNVATLPATILFPKAILAPDYTLDIDFNHLNRPLPMQLIVFPVKQAESYASPVLPNGCDDIVYFIET